LEQNIKAGTWQLSAEDIAAIDVISGGQDASVV
jgi:hypothetical protein